MGQAKRRKQAELERQEARARGDKKWDKSVLREVLRSIAPPGVEAIATRYDPATQEILIACDDGEVRRVAWQMLTDAEREQAPVLVIPEATPNPFLERVQEEQQVKLKTLQAQMRAVRQQILEQAQRQEEARQKQQQQQQQDQQQQKQDKQDKQQDKPQGPDWELAAARCAELEIACRPDEILCGCLRGMRENHPSHSNGSPCQNKPAYAVIGSVRSGKKRGKRVLCEGCAITSLNYSPDPFYKLDCDAE